MNDCVLKEGDGCDLAVSHVPRGVLEGKQRFSHSFLPHVLLSSALLQHLESV